MNAQLIASTDLRLIVGLGATGRSVARWWARQGHRFIATDASEALATDAQLQADIDPAHLHLGAIDGATLEQVTEAVVSPGVPMDDPVVASLRSRGCRIRGDVDVFMEQVAEPVVGITGSNGKSTVTSLLGEMLIACGVRAAVGGNLGPPALELLGRGSEAYVLELSSFQLERSESLGLEVATVLNITEDHLDRYSSLSQYHRAKHRIFSGARRVVANREDPLTVPLLPDDVEVIWWRPSDPDLEEFGVRDIEGVSWICHGWRSLISADELPLAGRHNLHNVLVALALGTALDMPIEGLLEGVRRYRGLPHRCQRVAEIDAVLYVDDSKGTNIGATIAALKGLGTAVGIWLILGGQGKGQNFSLLKDSVAEHCAGVIVLGEAAADITAALSSFSPCHLVDSIEAAVALAARSATPGQLVLLSPACASLDMFSSYVERGERFQTAVRALEAAA